MANNKKNIIFSAETSEFRKEIEEASRSIKSLNNELKLNKEELKNSSDNTSLLEEKIDLLNKEYTEQAKIVENTYRQYEKAVEMYGKNSKEAENLKNKLIQAETKQQSLANQIEDTNNQLIKQKDNFITLGSALTTTGKQLEDAGNKISSVGNTLSKFSAVATAGVVAVSKSAIDFESAFTGVEKTVDATESQLASLREEILEMSKEIPSSAVEISSVAEAAGQLGIQTDNIISFSKAMIDLGNSTNLAADEAASELAKFANITEMSQKDFDRLGATIVDLGNNYATTEADIVSMSMRLAGAGHQVNLSEAEILGLATALSSVGIEAEMGGSAISKAMVKMQNAVELGGEKLNVVLKKTGLTLRQLELMSANDSKGFKELSQSIGMTSTEVKNLITAGTNLEDFAKVSGMTAEQFKKAWKEDAAGALSAFIQGLGNAEEKGDSAIALLTEMGLTEVRLRDSLLRAANAGTLFSDAINTGTKAWEKNVALTNEADKRYSTTESQLKKLKNEVIAMAIELGDELLPSIIDIVQNSKPLLNSIASLIKGFSELDDQTKQNIIKMGAFSIAAGPVITVTGKIISSIGKTATSIGSLTTAIGMAKNGLSTASTGASLFGSTIAALSNPTTLAIVGITALTAAVTAYCLKQEEETIAMGKNLKAIQEQNQSRKDLINTQKEQLSANLGEISNTETLWNELKQITDENGKIKDGYEKRANFIITELSSALGTEITLNGDIINGYQTLQEEIDKTILKKKAEVIVSSQEEAYTEALNNRSKAYEELIELQEDFSKAHSTWLSSSGRESAQAKMQMDILNNSIKEQSILIDGYADDIANYEYNLQLMQTNTTESLEELVNRNMIAYQVEASSRDEALQKQIEITVMEIDTNKRKYEQMIADADMGNATMYQNQITANQNQLQALAEQLVAMTSTVTELTPAQLEAWTLLSEGSKNAYYNAISQLPPETQKQISAVTGVINLDTSVETASKNLGTDSTKLFVQAINPMQSGTVEELRKITAEIDNNTEVERASGDLGWGARENFLIKADGETTGKNYDEGIQRGIDNNQGGIFNSIWSLGSRMLSSLQQIFDSHSPSRETEKFGKYYDEGLIVGIISSKEKVLAAVTDLGESALETLHQVLDSEENQMFIKTNLEDFSTDDTNNLLTDGVVTRLQPKTIIANFYPQQMSEDELERCEKYIAEKWGAEL